MGARRRRARGARNDALLIAALIVLIGSVVAGAGYLSWQGMQTARDPVTLCPKKSGPTGHVVLLIDTTDPLTFVQKRAVRQRLEDIASKEVKEGELLSLFILGEDYQESPEPVFEKCNPGNSAGKSELTENLKRLDQNYEEKYLLPLRDASAIVFADRPASQSPLLEMLQMVSINAFKRAGIQGGLRLIVISDMLHHTKGFTLYKGPQQFSDLRKAGYYQRVRTEFPGVRVEVDYLMHSPDLQTMKTTLFWEEYFDDAKAVLDLVKPLEG
jgi:hypothetical protein